MNAVIVDTHRNSQVGMGYEDYRFDRETAERARAGGFSRYGHVRAQEEADLLNAHEVQDGTERFQVVICGPKIGARVKVWSYGAMREARVIARRVVARRQRLEIQVRIGPIGRYHSVYERWIDSAHLAACNRDAYGPAWGWLSADRLEEAE
jgi:hypothetical protein